MIATLEALGLLLALLAFSPAQELNGTKTVIQVPTFTDNRGNVINKLMTTRFPLCAIVMELAAQAEYRGVRMEAQWTPRDQNQEANDPSKPPNERLRSRERREGGFGGSELVRDAPAAGKRSNLPRGEAKRSAAAKNRKRKHGEESDRGEHAVLQSLVVVKAQ